MTDEDFDQRCRFLHALASAMQRCGVVSSSMESQLAQVARSLGLHGQFLATPIQVESVLWDDDDHQRVQLTVSSGGNWDMSKLSQLMELVSQVESGATNLADGLTRARAIDRAGPDYGPGTDALAFALCGLGFGVILGISWLDALLGGTLSVVTFGLSRWAVRSKGLTSTLELLVSAVASALATVLTRLFPGSVPAAVAVCACIYFVPGFGLTLGASELMTGNTLSGMIGFTRAMVTSVKLVIGGVIGSGIVAGLAAPLRPDVTTAVPHAWAWLFAPGLVLGLAVLFRVRRRDLPWPILGGVLVWLGLEAGATLGFWEGPFIGAFLLVYASRSFARKTGLPAGIILLPAVMLLVPGFATLRAFYVGQTQGLVEGLRATSNVLVLVAALLGGVLVAEAAYSVRTAAMSRRDLQALPRQAGTHVNRGDETAARREHTP